MAEIAFEKVMEPLSPDAPSGPDLDLEGDAAYWGFTSQLDVFLPNSYATFDRTEKPVGDLITAAQTLLTRSIDLRLLTAIAKLSILDLKFADFERTIATIALLLEARWDDIHPQMNEMNEGMRFNALNSLDDLPHVVMPLQHAPLFRSRRLGPVTLRMQMLAEGQIEGRAETESNEAEKIPSSSDMRAAMDDAPADEVTAAFEAATRLARSFGAIETIFVEKTGASGAFTLSRSRAIAENIRAFLEKVMVAKGLIAAPAEARPDPDGSPDSTADRGAGGARQTGTIKTMAQAARALDVAAQYFSFNEPSSPSRLFLAQARTLVGKTLFEALQELVPDHAEKAMLALGRDFPVSLPVGRLVSFLPADTVSLEWDEGESLGDGSETNVAEGWNEPVPDGSSGAAEYEETGGDENPDAGSSTDTDAQNNGGSAEAAPDDAAAEDIQDSSREEPAAAPVRKNAAPLIFEARTRAEALGLLEDVVAYYRSAEPSSPIPALLEAARRNAGMEFSQLLQAMLPELYLRVDE